MNLFKAIGKQVDLGCEVLGLIASSDNCRYPDTLPKGVRTALLEVFRDNKAYRGVPETVIASGEEAVDAYKARIKAAKAKIEARAQQRREERRRKRALEAQQQP